MAGISRIYGKATIGVASAVIGPGGFATPRARVAANVEVARFIHSKSPAVQESCPSVDDSYNHQVRAYWKPYARVSTRDHHFYASRNHLQHVRYIPNIAYFAAIEPFLNNLTFADAIDDKSYYSELFSGVNQPETLVRGVSGSLSDSDFKQLSVKDALDVCSTHDEVVLKPSLESRGGNGIRFLRPAELRDADEFGQLLSDYRGNFVIQAVVNQHPTLAELNATSTNTLRLMTLTIPGASPAVVSAILRVGAPDARVDNRSSGGYFCGVTLSGRAKDAVYDSRFRMITQTPIGTKMCNMLVPGFSSAVATVERLHARFGHFRVISWDIAIDEHALPTIIEFNLARQAIDLHQVANGPLFGDLTQMILGEVFGGEEGKRRGRLVGMLDADLERRQRLCKILNQRLR